jgi:hypothetical protein
MRTHLETIKRPVHVVNLDPAAEHFEYPVSVGSSFSSFFFFVGDRQMLTYLDLADIAELITVGDVMEELKYGPNGGLLYALEFLAENEDWLREKLGDFDDDYLIIDCPGQV